MNNPVTKDHLAKRLLVKAVVLTDETIHECRVLEITSNGQLVKLLLGHTPPKWVKSDSFEVLEVLPDKSLIEELSAALQLAKQENKALLDEKANVDVSLTKLKGKLEEVDRSVAELRGMNTALVEENARLKEQTVTDAKTVLALREQVQQLELANKALVAKVAKP